MALRAHHCHDATEPVTSSKMDAAGASHRQKCDDGGAPRRGASDLPACGSGVGNETIVGVPPEAPDSSAGS